MMSDTGEILLGRAGGVATLTINRPQALNALTLANYRHIAPALAAWAADPAVHAVVVRGAGGRAFCAGGDVRAVYEAGRGTGAAHDLTAVFFAEEYRLIRDIHRFPKALYRDHRRHHDGRRRRDLGQRRLSGSRLSAPCSRCRRPGSASFPMSARPGF